LNFAFDDGIRNAQGNLEGNQFLVYVDDGNLMGESISTIKKSKVHTQRECEKGRREENI
jgi:acetyl-CoA carboxylase beta subunit